MENRRFAFLSPLWGDLGATYDDHLGLIGKQHLATKVQLTLAGSPLSSGIPCGAEKTQAMSLYYQHCSASVLERRVSIERCANDGSCCAFDVFNSRDTVGCSLGGASTRRNSVKRLHIKAHTNFLLRKVHDPVRVHSGRTWLRLCR